MTLTLETDDTGQILAATTGLTDGHAQFAGQHLAHVFTVSQHYDSPLRAQWFAIIRRRAGVPTAITRTGDTQPSLLILRGATHNPDHYEVTIAPLPQTISSSAPLPTATNQLATAIEHSEGTLYIRGIDGRMQLIVGNQKNRPQNPEPLSIGQSIFDTYLPHTLLTLQQVDEEIIASGQLVQITEQVVDTLGNRVFSSTKFPIYGDNGELTAISGLSHDITDYSRSLTRLSENQIRITRSIMSSSLAVLVTTLDGKITDSNPAFTSKYGYAKDSIVGRTAAETGIISVQEQASLIDLVARDGEVVNRHLTVHTVTRTPVAVIMSAFVAEIDGKPHLVTMSADESRAQAAERRLQLIADASFEGIVMHDKNTILEVNQTMCEIAGRSREELIGLAIWELIPASDRTAVREVSAEDSHASYEFTLVRPDQSLRTVMTRSHDVTEGGQLYRITVMRDITDEQALKLQLHRAQKMELLGQLTGGIAHDFNNILASILGFSDLLVHQLQATREEKLLRWAEQIKKSGMRGRDLIKQMLTFSRGGTAQPVPTDPVEVTREVLEMVKVSLPAAITLKTNIDQAVKKVLIDPTQLNQVVLNLGINASHAVADHGKDGTAGIISIGVTEQTIDHHRCAGCLADVTGDYVAITVEDNGSGMSSETIEKIFEPFFSTKEVGEGTGMGLAVLHGIIHDCGGHILVNSQLGEGSRFTVLLPEIATTPIKKGSTPGDHQSKTIAIVDDDQLVADMVYRVLQQQGYHVFCFHQPQQAWEEFNRNGQHWDLLITDQNMPVLTGLELTRKIRQRRPHLPIIIHTGYSAELTQALAQELEFVLLEKPVEQKQMLTTIAELLESSGGNELDGTRSHPS